MKPEDEIPVAVATTQDQWRRQRIAKDQVQVAQVRFREMVPGVEGERPEISLRTLRSEDMNE